MHELRSEHLSKRLNLAMLIIVVSVLMLALPLIIQSYQCYQKNAVALSEMQSLKAVAELANLISSERGPANSAMSSTKAELQTHLLALKTRRAEVDLALQRMLVTLKQSQNKVGTHKIVSQLVPALKNGRDAVDAYIDLPIEQRSSVQLNHAIRTMFSVWDESYDVLQSLVDRSHGQETASSHYYPLILLLADLRDQAGRSASNIIAAVAFNESIPEDDLARSLQTQRQSRYLWKLIDVIHPNNAQSAEFTRLHQQVKTRFLDQGLPLVDGLLFNSLHHEPYTLSSIELTQKIVGHFRSVVELQNYILDSSVLQAEAELNAARTKLLYTLVSVFLCLAAVIVTMIYAKKWVFAPLIHARQQLFDLAQDQAERGSASASHSVSLFDAIFHLKQKLQERDALEFQLKHHAYTDSLTGVSNRFALMKYVALIEQSHQNFSNHCMILFDVDKFKAVNDQHGHVVGDRVIEAVALTMKDHIRATDMLVRYGGDEFLILLEHVDLAQALQIAEKVRLAVLDIMLQVGNSAQPLTVSVSAGVATGEQMWVDLLEKADEALFRAKVKGRNVVSD